MTMSMRSSIYFQQMNQLILCRKRFLTICLHCKISISLCLCYIINGISSPANQSHNFWRFSSGEKAIEDNYFIISVYYSFHGLWILYVVAIVWWLYSLSLIEVKTRLYTFTGLSKLTFKHKHIIDVTMTSYYDDVIIAVSPNVSSTLASCKIFTNKYNNVEFVMLILNLKSRFIIDTVMQRY